MSNIWIVGNANEKKSINHLVHKDDTVIRFNNPNSTCSLKPTILFMSTAYSFLNFIFTRPNEVNWETIFSAKKIIYRWTIKSVLLNKPESLSVFHRIKFIRYFYRFSKFKKLPDSTLFFPRKKFIEYQRELQMSAQPSSGILAVLWCLENSPKQKIFIHNFTFEGWDGHDWGREKEFLHHLEEMGKIQIVQTENN
jgi:hypothetical protein